MAGDRDDPLPLVMSEQQAASYLGISYWTLRRWRVNESEGRPPHRDIGGEVRYIRTSLDAWLDDQGEKS